MPPPSLLTFNATGREYCIVRRELSTMTPLQALVLLNDPQYIEAARVLAVDALAGSGDAWIGAVFPAADRPRAGWRGTTHPEGRLRRAGGVVQRRPRGAKAYVTIGEKALPEGADPCTWPRPPHWPRR